MLVLIMLFLPMSGSNKVSLNSYSSLFVHLYPSGMNVLVAFPLSANLASYDVNRVREMEVRLPEEINKEIPKTLANISDSTETMKKRPRKS